MNTFTYQTLKDTTTQSVIKLTGSFDGSGNEDNPSRISASSLFGALNQYGFPLINGGSPLPYYGFSIKSIWISISKSLIVNLYYNSSSKSNFIILNNNGIYSKNAYSIPISNLELDTNGDIGISTINAQNNSYYSIVIEIIKDNKYYDYGQLQDGQAFNYFPITNDVLDNISTEDNQNIIIPTYIL